VSETFEEWGIRLLSGRVVMESAEEHETRKDLSWYLNQIPPVDATLVKRTVTHTEWEQVND
jgi:hypothetical protein